MRTLNRILIGVAALLALTLLAAWQVPARLDWARYRGSIAAFASARLGRAVTIGGQVRLSLLPSAALTAGDVTLADRGDGISARVGALRLQVAFWPLLRGRVVPLDLVLDDPVMNVPWPLPKAIDAVPALAPGFAASTEGGALHLGALTLTAVTAALHVDPDTGAFGAQGTGSVQGRPCRFTALIGAPGADGVATLTLTLDGQGGLQGTGGSFRGRMLAGHAVEGVVAARGPNLALLLPAPDAPWRLQGGVLASDGEVRARDVQFTLANSPGQADVALRMSSPARIEATIKIGQFALGGWIAGLGRPSLAIPLHLDVHAQAATWRGRAVRDPALVLDLGGASSSLTADAALPGDARLHVSALLQAGAAGAVLAGKLSLAVPNLPATAVLLSETPGVPPTWTAGLPPRADLQGRVRLDRRQLELADLTLLVGGSKVTGDAALDLAVRPVVHAALLVDHIVVAVPSGGQGALIAPMEALFRAVDSDLDLHADKIDTPYAAAAHVAVRAFTGARGVVLRRVAADLPGLHLDGGASIAPDLTLAGAHLDLTSTDAAALPPAWRVPAALWQGPFHLALTASGPPRQIVAQARADLGDLRAEAEGHLDSLEPRLTATVTLRHPGTPRLLASLGLPDAQRWIDSGSLALQAHLAAWPGHLRAEDFSIAAAALHASGQIDADFSGPHPILSARVDASSLTLPRFDARSQAPLPIDALANWRGQMALHADQVSWGATTVASQASVDFAGSGGIVTAYVKDARIAGGHFEGAIAIDMTRPGPLAEVHADLTGAAMDGLPSLPPLSFTGGSIDFTTNLSATGYSPTALLATMSGDAHATVHGSALLGVNLPQLTGLLAAPVPKLRAALTSSMADGDTGPLSGHATAVLQQGAVTLRRARLSGDAGSVDIEGSIDLAARTANLALEFQPAVTDPPTLGLRLAGPWQGGRRAVDVRPALLWAGAGTAKKARGSAPRTPSR